MNSYWYSKVIMLVSSASDFQVCTSDTSQHNIWNKLFKCKSGAYISPITVCDTVIDCPKMMTQMKHFALAIIKTFKSSNHHIHAKQYRGTAAILCVHLCTTKLLEDSALNM